MPVFEFTLIFSASAFALFLVFRIFDKGLSLWAGILFAAYIGLDDLVTGLPYVFSALRLFEAAWNWSGKVYSIMLAALVLTSLRINPAAAGLTMSQRNLSASIIALLGFVLWGLALGLFFRPDQASAETIAFQATMPGLAEELAYRGIAPVLLLGLHPARPAIHGIPWSVIALTACVFAVWHGLRVSQAGISFDLVSAAVPFVGSIAGGWLRFSSGSLVFPTLAHGAANVAFHAAPRILL